MGDGWENINPPAVDPFDPYLLTDEDLADPKMRNQRKLISKPHLKQVAPGAEDTKDLPNPLLQPKLTYKDVREVMFRSPENMDKIVCMRKDYANEAMCVP